MPAPRWEWGGWCPCLGSPLSQATSLAQALQPLPQREAMLCPFPSGHAAVGLLQHLHGALHTDPPLPQGSVAGAKPTQHPPQLPKGWWGHDGSCRNQVSIYPCACPSQHPPIHPSTHLSMPPSIPVSIHPCSHSSRYLSVHAPVHPSICPCMSSSIPASICPCPHPSTPMSIHPCPVHLGVQPSMPLSHLDTPGMGTTEGTQAPAAGGAGGSGGDLLPAPCPSPISRQCWAELCQGTWLPPLGLAPWGAVFPGVAPVMGPNGGSVAKRWGGRQRCGGCTHSQLGLKGYTQGPSLQPPHSKPLWG